MKVCSACSIDKDDQLFLVDKRYKDKLFPICLSCLSCLPQEKVCTKCNKSLDKSLFNKEKKNKDGLTSCCKSCHSFSWKKFNAANSDHVKRSRNEWARKHPEKVKESRQKHYKKNKDAVLKRSKNYLKTHPQIRKSITHRYYLKNKLYYKLKCAERKARKQRLTIVKFSTVQFEQRMSVFGDKCFYCGGPFQHVDHAIALIRNGYHCLANLRPSCESCNLRKGSKSFTEFLSEIRTK